MALQKLELQLLPAQKPLRAHKHQRVQKPLRAHKHQRVQQPLRAHKHQRVQQPLRLWRISDVLISGNLTTIWLTASVDIMVSVR